MPNVHKVDLVGQEVVALELGVTSQAISNWYKREATSGESWGMPVPTLIQYRPGKTPLKCWRRAQLATWVKWHNAHLAEASLHIPAKLRKRQKAAA
jgi:hypothetical protein